MHHSHVRTQRSPRSPVKTLTNIPPHSNSLQQKSPAPPIMVKKSLVVGNCLNLSRVENNSEQAAVTATRNASRRSGKPSAKTNSWFQSVSSPLPSQSSTIYSISNSPHGRFLLVENPRGICHLAIAAPNARIKLPFKAHSPNLSAQTTGSDTNSKLDTSEDTPTATTPTQKPPNDEQLIHIIETLYPNAIRAEVDNDTFQTHWEHVHRIIELFLNDAVEMKDSCDTSPPYILSPTQRAFAYAEVASFPLDIDGTEFQRHVWQALCNIPWGETRTYQEIAEAIGKPQAVRAVANACGANKIALLVPCHRVVRTGGGLGGFALGLEVKERLLRLEKSVQMCINTTVSK